MMSLRGVEVEISDDNGMTGGIVRLSLTANKPEQVREKTSCFGGVISKSITAELHPSTAESLANELRDAARSARTEHMP